jgi:hypothetical protein
VIRIGQSFGTASKREGPFDAWRGETDEAVRVLILLSKC